MKKFLLPAFLFIALVPESIAQVVPKRVVVEHFTNTLCSICASRNPGFYTNLQAFPDVLHIAFHPSAPYPACPLNQHNVAENDARTNYYGVYGGTPRLVIQGAVIPANTPYTDPTLFQSEMNMFTTFDLSASLTETSPGMLEVRTVIRKTEIDVTADLILYAALVEDTLFFNAGNGENIHYDVFRKSVYGAPLPVSVAMAVGDSVVNTMQVPLNSVWNREGMYVVAMLQNPDKTMVQAAQSNHLPVTSGIQSFENKAIAYYPNPVKDKLNLGLEKMTSYKLMDALGKTVQEGMVQAELSLKQLPAGIFYLMLSSNQGNKTLKVIKE